jgi:hypothetical protein
MQLYASMIQQPRLAKRGSSVGRGTCEVAEPRNAVLQSPQGAEHRGAGMDVPWIQAMAQNEPRNMHGTAQKNTRIQPAEQGVQGHRQARNCRVVNVQCACIYIH